MKLGAFIVLPALSSLLLKKNETKLSISSKKGFFVYLLFSLVYSIVGHVKPAHTYSISKRFALCLMRSVLAAQNIVLIFMQSGNALNSCSVKFSEYRCVQ